MSLIRVAWSLSRPVLHSAFPNLMLLLVISANFMWISRVLPIHYIDVPYFRISDVWLESVPTVAALVAIDVIAISLFARKWRARRWGRKPHEIETATRYFTV